MLIITAGDEKTAWSGESGAYDGEVDVSNVVESGVRFDFPLFYSASFLCIV